MPHLHMIQWPNRDFSVRLPAKFLEQIGVRENDEVEIFCLEDRVVIRRASDLRQEEEEKVN